MTVLFILDKTFKIFIQILNLKRTSTLPLNSMWNLKKCCRKYIAYLSKCYIIGKQQNYKYLNLYFKKKRQSMSSLFGETRLFPFITFSFLKAFKYDLFSENYCLIKYLQMEKNVLDKTFEYFSVSWYRGLLFRRY